MSGLRELQAAMAAALQRGDESLAVVAPGLARGNDRLSPSDQLAIYREQYLERHLGCLCDDFPAVLGLLGGEDFLALGKAYLAVHPPSSFSLRDLGGSFPDFLRVSLAADPRLDAAVDLARLEWALLEAYDAASAPPLDPATLAAASPEDLDGARLSFAPSFSVLSLSSPVHRIHPLASGGLPFELPAPAPGWLVVHRRGTEVGWGEVPWLAGRALEELRRGDPLAVALDRVAAGLADEQAEQLARHVGGWFASWVQEGWVCGVQWPAGGTIGAGGAGRR
jgi:hypothetical protein